jgi:hypothetical protein
MMRRGFNSGWLIEGTNFMGVNLGSDFTSEHEWGIKDLRKVLGVDDDKSVLGIERRIIKSPKDKAVRLIEEEEITALIVREYSSHDEGKKIKDYSHGELSISSNEEMATAWSSCDLGICVKRPKDIKRLKKVHDAIMNNGAAIWLGGGHVFQNAGLVIALLRQIPDNLKQVMYDADADAIKLQKASEATGIKQRIDALNEKYREAHPGTYRFPCGYFALSPSWAKGFAKTLTKHPVVYWLNPANQQVDNAGWYTVEQLEQWMEGNGPVLMDKPEIDVEVTDLLLFKGLSEAEITTLKNT